MGYYSYISGKMTFSRALKRDEIQNVRLVMRDSWNVYELHTETEERETDEGLLTITRATSLRAKDDQLKAYEWERVLQEIISALPEGVSLSGYFERIGEEQPDMERLYVKGREVISVKPEIVWPAP